MAECIESIQAQTLRDIEIILVDDGSPDRCGEIAECYAVEDDRIKVVHRVNGGLGPARNSGMEVASGEYIGFVDSDDWIEADMYERLYGAAKACDADIVYTGLKTVRFGTVDQVLENPFAGKTLSGDEEIFQLRRGFYGAPAARVKDEAVIVSVDVAGFKRTFIEGNRLKFLAVRSEDKFFNTEACRKASVVTCISGTPYCYRKDDQPSITKSFNRKTVESFFTLFRLLSLMANEEPGLFFEECQLRKDRCIIDYSRVVIGMIEESSESNEAKKRYISEVLNHACLREAILGFPWFDLPVQQALFYIALRMRSVNLVRLMTRLKRGY